MKVKVVRLEQISLSSLVLKKSGLVVMLHAFPFAEPAADTQTNHAEDGFLENAGTHLGNACFTVFKNDRDFHYFVFQFIHIELHLDLEAYPICLILSKSTQRNADAL